METGEDHKQVSSASHTPLGIPQNRRDSHFSTAPTTVSASKAKAKTKPKTKEA